MFNLLSKDTVFYDLFEDLAKHGVSAAEHLRKMARGFPNSANELQYIRNHEHEADTRFHALDRLDRIAGHAFDREDIRMSWSAG